MSKEIKVKIELSITEDGYDISGVSNNKLSLLEVLGISEMLKVAYGANEKTLKVDKDLKLSIIKEEKQPNTPIFRALRAEDLPEKERDKLFKILEKLTDSKDDCTCTVCQIRRGELNPKGDLTEEQLIELKDISKRNSLTLEQLLDKMYPQYLKVNMQGEQSNPDEGKMPFMFHNGPIGEA